MNKKDYPRTHRVNELLKRELSYIISNQSNDPRLKFVTIASVDTTKDFSLSRVYITSLNSENKKEIINVLRSATGFFRTEIAKKVNLKKLPKLEFIYDVSLDYGIKMDLLIDSLHNKRDNDNNISNDSDKDNDKDININLEKE